MKDISIQAPEGKISLSKPSKMPGYSWSLPAGKTCPAAKLTVKEFGEAAICSGCYAKTGFYRMANVQDAQSRRLRWILRSLRENGGDEAVEGLTTMIRNTDLALFRVHDSGDLFSDAYIGIWVRVAKALPWVRFWIPTREWVRPEQHTALAELAQLPNVTLRPSAMAIGHEAPNTFGLDAGTTVSVADLEGHYTCPSTVKGNPSSCAENDCTMCWNPTVPVTYLVHSAPALEKAGRKALPVLASA